MDWKEHLVWVWWVCTLIAIIFIWAVYVTKLDNEFQIECIKAWGTIIRTDCIWITNK
jgi:hypothetical protein